jgi:EmrB/QacA subfamily drug resistance transporter
MGKTVVRDSGATSDQKPPGRVKVRIPGTHLGRRQENPVTSPTGRSTTVLLTAIAYFMVTLDALVVVTALPSIHKSLGGDLSALQWTVSAYTIAFGAGILTASAVGDRLGRRRVYVAGLALFSAASAACALATTTSMLTAFRAVQGLGAAIVLPLGLTILTSAFPQEKRGAVVGLWGGIAGLAVASGPLIGGGITQALNWHWIFWVNVPIGAIATVGARLRLPESYGPRSRLDVPALVLVSGGVGTLTWGLIQGGQNGWGTSQTLTGLLIGAALLAGFVWWEGRAPEPMIPLGLFRRLSFSSAVTTQFFLSASIFSAAFLTSQFFQFGLGYSPLRTGLWFLPWTATPLFVAPVAGALSDRLGPRALIVPGLAMQAIGFGWMIHLASGSPHPSSFVVPFIIAGVGISMSLPSLTAGGLNAVPQDLLGKAAGTLNTAQQFGVVFGVAAVTAVFNARGNLTSAAAVTSGYRAALAVSAGASVLGALTAVGIRRRAAAVAADPREEDLRVAVPEPLMAGE